MEDNSFYHYHGIDFGTDLPPGMQALTVSYLDAHPEMPARVFEAMLREMDIHCSPAAIRRAWMSFHPGLTRQADERDFAETLAAAMARDPEKAAQIRADIAEAAAIVAAIDAGAPEPPMSELEQILRERSRTVKGPILDAEARARFWAWEDDRHEC